MSNTRHTTFLAVLIPALALLAVILSACGLDPTTAPTQIPEPTLPPEATPVPPTPAPVDSEYWPTAGWRTSTPEEQGIDSEKLAELMDYLQEIVR